MKTFSMREKKKRYAGYTLVAPAIILLIITFLVPMAYSLMISLSSSDGIIANHFEWVGLENYISVLKK